MDSGTEVLAITAAIVSTFQNAADTLERIRDRKEKRKKKKDKEAEELLQIRILHNSLVEGGKRCRRHCENRQRQFSPAFEAGDPIAILALKEVVISLQTEIIQALHVARAVENAVLDFNTLHEASVSNRKDATKAMDQLCQRITASIQFQSQHGADTSGAVLPSDSSTRPSVASMPLSELRINVLSDFPLPPSPPSSVGSPPPRGHPGAPSFQQILSTRRPGDTVGQRGGQQAHCASPLSWRSSRAEDRSGDAPAGNARSTTTSEDQQDLESSIDWEFEQRINSSLQISDDTELEQQAQSSTQSSGLGFGIYTMNSQSTGAAMPPNSRYAVEPLSPRKAEFSPTGSQATFERLPQYSQQERASSARGTHKRNNGGSLADEAPEVVPASPDAITPIRSSEDMISPIEKPPTGTHPALRTPQPTKTEHAESVSSLPTGMDDIWLPLTRPALHNRYHGFCKGAWDIRISVREGLEIKTAPSLKEPVRFWACKECKFRLKAPTLDALPSHVVANEKYGVLYRWVFLAKSHQSTDSSCDSAESYKYGCIFCAAQGLTTTVHNKLDHLLVHIISKHKITMMSRDVREKTRCIVGSVPDEREDWDISISVSNQKGAGVVADELMISASKLFNRKGKRGRK